MIRRRAVGLAVPSAVICGLAVSAAVVGFMDRPPDDLPGVALESGLILAVERVIVLFAAWMAVVIVVARALEGELPTEISGQGIKYADAETAGRAAARTEAALESLWRDLEELRQAQLRGADTLC